VVIFLRNLFILVILAIFGGTIALFWNIENKLTKINYTEFKETLAKGEVVEVILTGGKIVFTDDSNRTFESFSPDISQLIPLLEEKKVIISVQSDTPSPFWNFLVTTLPIGFVLLAMFFYVKKQNQQNNESSSDFVKNKTVEIATSDKKVTFDDVAGIPEAKEELVEIIDFLKNPDKFNEIGATIPKGVLLQGPPGTGKTLLARAIAGEAGTPFFSFSGSDFVEMFVGVGASRVRDLFKEAKKNSPCIVFIDEIDAVGVHRGAAGAIGGQDERGQTLNALLVEMDGFGTGDTIVVLAATNRPDILDPALMRPGRFDRQITILAPDVKGRRQILEVYAQRVKISDSVDFDQIARSTPGFTGAELANLVNEAALLAARNNQKQIKMIDFEAAKDRILMGVERKGLVISDKDRKTMAFHEAGHAIVARFLPESDPLHKITIIPRGKAMGHTQQLPLKDRHAYSMEYLQNRICILLGGRAAEEIALKQRTTGAQDDLARATDIASKMICKWGMNDAIGPLAYLVDGNGFLGDDGTRANYSEETAKRIDQEIRNLIEGCYRQAIDILTREQYFLHNLSEILLQTETLDYEELDIIFKCTRKKEKQKAAAEAGESVEVHECSTCSAASHCSQKPEEVHQG
jgi:cell division protease FtsH